MSSVFIFHIIIVTSISRQEETIMVNAIVGIVSVIGLGILAAVVIVWIYNLFDTSPTQDPRCRGGHDF